MIVYTEIKRDNLDKTEPVCFQTALGKDIKNSSIVVELEIHYRLLEMDV